MEITTVVTVCIITAVLALMLRQYKPEYSLLLSMACGVVVILYLLDGITAIRTELERILSAVTLPDGLLEVVFKGLGICILSELASQSCRDAGENSIAVKAELAGKVALVLISMPLFYRLLSLAAELLAVAG